MDKNATSITPSYPPQKISEEVSHTGQFSMQINLLSGSFLRATQQQCEQMLSYLRNRFKACQIGAQ